VGRSGGPPDNTDFPGQSSGQLSGPYPACRLAASDITGFCSFLVRTVVIPSFTPYVKSDSPDSRLKSESFCCRGLFAGQIEHGFGIATPHFRQFGKPDS